MIKKIVAYEALSRLKDVDLDIISFFSIVNFFEHKGVIDYLIDSIEIDFQILQKPIHLNIIPSDIKHLISLNNSIDKNNIILEIPEHSLCKKDVNYIIELSSQYNFYLDDLGKDYSMWQYIPRLVVQGVKLDKFLIDQIQLEFSPQYKQMLRAIATLGALLNIPITCEGVETITQHIFLRENGFDYGQGYYYSRPYPIKHWLTY